MKKAMSNISPLAGKPAREEDLVDIPKLIKAYYNNVPDASVAAQRIVFGTSGHRGSSLKKSFNEHHILAITEAICLYRKAQKTDGPLYIGFDTHALSIPAFATALEVLAANGVEVMVSENGEYTPTPVISHAILKYNAGRKNGLADGIVITPSHNPPGDGGFKYNPANGGPAGTTVVKWIETRANQIMESGIKKVKRVPFERALTASTTHRHNYLTTYITDLGAVINMDLIRDSKIKMGVDPLGGAGVNYWGRIAELYKLDLTVTNNVVDSTFGFMTLDWDGQIRMDPSSSYVMQRLIKLKNKFDISFACDTDHDRHGIVTKGKGLLNPNDYLSVAVSYLLQNRPNWRHSALVGKTVVTTGLIERVAKKLGRKVYDVPVGFKWFADGLFDSSLCFGAEESAGASFSRLNGHVWTTDKDGIIAALLSAEITASAQKDIGVLYADLTKELGMPYYERLEAKATSAQKEKLKRLSPDAIKQKSIAGEKIITVIKDAPANSMPIDGIKVITQNGWFAARPSGTESIYKIYAESFLSKDHLNRIIEEGQNIVNATLSIKEKVA